MSSRLDGRRWWTAAETGSRVRPTTHPQPDLSAALDRTEALVYPSYSTNTKCGRIGTKANAVLTGLPRCRIILDFCGRRPLGAASDREAAFPP
jgi:hypothetical protein